MDDGSPKVAAESAVMTVRTREVGTAWAMRSLGIALAFCMCLTVGGDLTVRAGAVPWSGILDPSRAIDWSHAGIPGGIPNRATICASLDPGSTAAQIDAAIAACILDQVDDAADGGDIYNCGIANGCVSQGSDGMRTAPGGYRNQRQIVKVTAIAGNQVTIAPGIYMPNWRASRAPQAWWPTTVLRRAGIENLTIQPVDGGGGINIQNAMECWITGVRSVKVAPPGGPGGGRDHVWLTMTRGNEIRSDYFYGSGGQSQSYGIEWYPGSDNLVENN